MATTSATERIVKLKKRKEWRVGRSIVDGRSRDGQIVWKGLVKGKGHTFLVRIGKDAARQVVGTSAEAVRELEKLRLELEGGTYTPPDRKIKFGTFLKKYYLPWKRPSLKPHTGSTRTRSCV